MAQKGIIRNTTTADISAENMAAVFHAIVGKSGIVKGFNDLACTKINDNSVQLASGVYALKGFMLHVESGTAITLPVDSGTAGQNRNDLLVAELVKNGGGAGVDTLQFRVLKGTSTSGTAVDPTLTQQDVNGIGTTQQEAVYRIKLNGTAIVTIELVAGLIGNLETTATDITGVENDIATQTIVESGGNALDGYYTKYGNGDVDIFGKIDCVGTFGTGSNASFNKVFPFNCVTQPVVVVSASMYDGVDAFQNYRSSAHLNGTNLNGFYGHAYCEYAQSAQTYIVVHYHAKAKWK